MSHHDDTTPPLPAMPCVASPTVEARLGNIEEGLHEIKLALVGNPKLGHRGLVARVELVETKVERHDRKLLVWGAIITAAGTGAAFAAQIIFH